VVLGERRPPDQYSEIASQIIIDGGERRGAKWRTRTHVPNWIGSPLWDHFGFDQREIVEADQRDAIGKRYRDERTLNLG
jgi:hypothetical protein